MPGASDAATIAFPGSYIVTVTAEAVKVGSITISNISAALDFEAPGNTETVSGSVANSGRLLIDANAPGGTILKIGGTLTNDGTFNIGNNAATATTKVSVGGLTETGFGSINVTGGAVLTVAGSSSNSISTLLQVDSSGIGGSQLNVGGC
ncbi:MAG: hypothetical protein ACREET_17250 [Stellaceae bacterium]